MGGNWYTHRDTPNNSDGDVGYPSMCFAQPDMPCDPDQGLNVYLWHDIARSRHPGGVNVAFVDGHVNFVPNAISWNVWQALGNRADDSTLGVGQY